MLRTTTSFLLTKEANHQPYRAITEYIDYYNNSRIQAKTKWMPPSKFREASMMES
ncbi:MAG: IS3 family transposase [Christensenellales bacterium]